MVVALKEFVGEWVSREETGKEVVRFVNPRGSSRTVYGLSFCGCGLVLSKPMMEIRAILDS